MTPMGRVHARRYRAEFRGGQDGELEPVKTDIKPAPTDYEREKKRLN